MEGAAHVGKHQVEREEVDLDAEQRQRHRNQRALRPAARRIVRGDRHFGDAAYGRGLSMRGSIIEPPSSECTPRQLVTRRSVAPAAVERLQLFARSIGVVLAKAAVLLHERDVQPSESAVQGAVLRVIEVGDDEAVVVHPSHYVVELRRARDQLKQRDLEQRELRRAQHLCRARQYVELRSLDVRLDDEWPAEPALLHGVVKSYHGHRTPKSMGVLARKVAQHGRAVRSAVDKDLGLSSSRPGSGEHDLGPSLPLEPFEMACPFLQGLDEHQLGIGKRRVQLRRPRANSDVDHDVWREPQLAVVGEDAGQRASDPARPVYLDPAGCQPGPNAGKQTGPQRAEHPRESNLSRTFGTGLGLASRSPRPDNQREGTNAAKRWTTFEIKEDRA